MSEEQRLEDQLLEKSSLYCQSVLDFEQYGHGEISINDWHVQHSEKQTAMIEAYKALKEYESNS